jgi:hypothetical protein
MMADYFAHILRQGVETGELHAADPIRDGRVFVMSLAFLFPGVTDERAYTPTEEDALFVVDWFLEVWRQPNASRAGAKSKRR